MTDAAAEVVTVTETEILVEAAPEDIIVEEITEVDVIETPAEQGPAGPPGADGAQGVDGAPGAAGAAGVAGAPGADGNAVLYGAGAPSNALGVDGNFYIDTTAHAIYGPKAAGVWPAGTSIVGPQGAAGAAGATGPAGPVAGTDKQIVVNDGGAAAGFAGLTWDKATNTLTIGGAAAVAGGTVTASKPVLDLSQTWNAGAVPFTGLKVNVTDTASAIASLLADFQVGGSSKASIAKDGSYTTGGGVLSGFVTTGTRLRVTTGASFEATSSGAVATGYFGFHASNATAVPDTVLYRGGPGILEQRNGANAQTFRLYNTFTDVANYERLALFWAGNAAFISAQGGGTGIVRPLQLNGSQISFSINGSGGWVINSGALSAGVDNTLDLGANASGRPRTGYFATSVEAPRFKATGFTVATLPSASTSGPGTIAAATDLTALTNGSTAAGGGALKGIVKSNGTNWIVLG